MKSLLLFLVIVLLIAAHEGVGAFLSHHVPAVSSWNKGGQYYFDNKKRKRAQFMFTGIVEEMGSVVSLIERDDMPLWDGSRGLGTELTIQGDVVLEGAYLGCSICVSGVCLTVTELLPDNNDGQFKVGLAPETLRRTYFANLKSGDAVNLERASEIGGRNSGHFVQGHVDDTGEIIEKHTDQDSLVFKIRVQNDNVNELMPYIVPKGFIAIDGTSLTVVDVNREEQWFTFMLVDYTQKKIIVTSKQVSDHVNIEVDVLGKYSQAALTTLIPRLEALEAKVHMLEKEKQQASSQDSSNNC